MSDIAIRVEQLGKMYRIGGKQERYFTLRDSLADIVISPFNRARSVLQGKAYGAAGLEETFWALKNVSFEVKHGEVVGIIGRNGAGKSTLLKILSRITEPTEGYADIFGRVGALLEVGTGFHPELTGRENIYLNGAILGMSRQEIDHKFDEIVEFAGIEKFIDTPVKHYSSGMSLRLGFAVAAHLEPEILVVDEVLAVGDAEFQRKCLGKMSDVVNEGRTVLFVSHNMSAVQNLCEYAYVLSHGGIRFSGSVEDAIKRYFDDIRTNSREIVLSDRTDRQGNGPFRFVGLVFRDKEMGNVLESVISGQNVVIEMTYETEDGLPPKGLRVSIGFWTITGAFMFACSNDAVGVDLRLVSNTGKIYCEILNWPLSAGDYVYTLYASQDRSMADRIKDAGIISVQNGDFYGTGRIPSPYQGVLVNYNYAI
ncbi:MAG: ABC transporter ATP-binding protein [Anaerolineae bacterium]|nr:ABC transporter ATP-binding protein [Anaerolineae bacterium]